MNVSGVLYSFGRHPNVVEKRKKERKISCYINTNKINKFLPIPTQSVRQFSTFLEVRLPNLDHIVFQVKVIVVVVEIVDNS